MRRYKTYSFKGQEQLTAMTVSRIRDAIEGGVTVYDIAQATNVRATTIYFWLRGDTKSATVPCLRAVLKALGADIVFKSTGKAAVATRKEFA